MNKEVKKEGQRIRLLAVDMDGTCLDRRSRMTHKTLEALRAAAKSGITVVPTTGRNLNCLPHRLAKEKDIYRYVISSNGAVVTDCCTGKDVFRTMIPKETALRLLKDCRGKRVGITIHLKHEYLIQGRLLVLLGHLIYGKDARGVRHVGNMERVIAGSRYTVEEIQLYFLSPGVKKEVESVLSAYPELSRACTPMYVEIFSKHTSKGTALSALAKKLGVEKEEIACIGDAENDLAMFDAAGLKMAVGNAVPDLKRKADIILPSNDRNGAAEGIRYILRAKRNSRP